MADMRSQKPIPVRDRLILALDVPDSQTAMMTVDRLGDSVNFYKLCLELFMSGSYFDLVDWLTKQGKRVFCDLKFFDVPETVSRAVRQLGDKGVDFTTVHGNDPMLRAAVAEKNGLKILAVTVLTSLDKGDLEDLGFQCDVKSLVLSRAKRALQIGCDGIISSGLEVPALRKDLGDQLIIVVPGIRPVENRPEDDQKRIVTPTQAFKSGADYIVVGRPIRDAQDPQVKAEEIQREIAVVFESME
jgi:orotidine-5'-phosphate decarboxylase